MSLGANLSSGYTQKVLLETLQCSSSQARTKNIESFCLISTSGQAVNSSIRLLQKVNACSPPTSAEFAKYQKVAVASSVLTQSRSNKDGCSERFSQYRRYEPPLPCIVSPDKPTSLPSVKQCPIYFIQSN